MIITTGGSGGEQQFTEGSVGRDYLIERGIGDRALIAETQSDNSAESAERIGTIMAANNMRTCIAVSDPYHEFRIKKLLEAWGMQGTLDNYGTALGIYTSALGAHLTWTLPFGLLIMFAIFNRFNPAYEEAARDLGATPWQGFRHVVLPLIAPSVVGIGMFGFTLSWDEIARTSQAIGDVNTLPLELQGLTTTVTTPSIYALGTVTMVVSFCVMGLAVGLSSLLSKRQKAGRHD